MTDEQQLALVAHDAAWRTHFDEESIRLSHALIVTAARIVHVGSTVVPGLMSMPTIDIMVGVERYPPTPAFIEPLETLAYTPCGERGLPGRLYYTKRGAVAFDLHLLQFGSRLWTRSLLLRDYLAANAQAADIFVQRKRELLAASKGNAETYAQLKIPVLAQLLDDAARWKPVAATALPGD